MAAGVRHVTIGYSAHDGKRRPAIVCVPEEFGPGRPTPPLPLVIAPHGRNVRPQSCAKSWGSLPAQGGFVTVCPGGRGRRLDLHSWGYRGQIADLARMPAIVRRALPWITVDERRIYAVGGSMGGQETLLLLGQFPTLLAGAVAIDSVTNFFRRYADFGSNLLTRPQQALARFEVGGAPHQNAPAYVLRSPTHWVRQVAASRVPLSIWWSTADQIVIDQTHQSAHFFAEVKKRRKRGRLEGRPGTWKHSERFGEVQLPGALRFLRLLPDV
jgi:poly(3-hydroxybutyrate) depolymerase